MWLGHRYFSIPDRSGDLFGDPRRDPRHLADRLPTDYLVEVSGDGKTWKAVATAGGRAATADSVTAEKLEQALTPDQRARRKQLAARVEELRGRLAGAAQVVFVVLQVAHWRLMSLV